MRKDAWLPKHDWTIISGVLSGRKSPDIARELNRTTHAVHARTRYLRENNLIHEGQTLDALISRHISLQKKQRDARIMEARRNWSREEKRAFAEQHRERGPTYIARQLSCSIEEVKELLGKVPSNSETRTRPCCRCRKVFTTPHKCRFLCDSCNAYASKMGWV